MTDHPERIWANIDLADGFSGQGLCGEWNHQDVGSPDDAEYVRADLCTPAPDTARLLEALKAIIARWDTPAWKDAEPTGAVIERGRAELAKWEGR